ncbi:MAG: hypothetical protein IPH11_16100 [Ignavibacteriales bacterium]|nr:hypothetical protein [Ignavibacteriales bacterium]
MPDGNIQRNKENLMKVIMAIRKFKPKLFSLLTSTTGILIILMQVNLLKEAMFASGLAKIKTFDREVPQKSSDLQNYFIICRLILSTRVLLLMLVQLLKLR